MDCRFRVRDGEIVAPPHLGRLSKSSAQAAVAVAQGAALVEWRIRAVCACQVGLHGRHREMYGSNRIDEMRDRRVLLRSLDIRHFFG
ncbi:hypothetical protein, partial [Burkholderia humptydooensis]|uniref:hypothetical protein n=1 Tax=Burkholderia humptydooensis TaxID=430531 RepID=UPI001E37A968